MTLREELELLRGEPIEIRSSAEKIPCNEISDGAKLCRHPVVSVHMITYNHEQFIRQAIESVMMQKTDFEFELIVGEDCSKDKTREICIEMQKKYPERIRVLLAEHNVNIGNNVVRVTARCRGELIAFCEGDDYWVDPLKLQKQVDAMRRCPNVSICFGMMQRHEQKTGRIIVDESLKLKWPSGVIDGREFALSDYVIPTPTVVLRRSIFDRACGKYEALSWRMNMEDFQLWKAMALEGDVYCLHDLIAAYRIHGASAMHTNVRRIMRDAAIMSLYFARVSDCFPPETSVKALSRLAANRCLIIAAVRDSKERKRLFGEFLAVGRNYRTLLDATGCIVLGLTKCGCYNLLSRFLWLRKGIKNRFHKWVQIALRKPYA